MPNNHEDYIKIYVKAFNDIKEILDDAQLPGSFLFDDAANEFFEDLKTLTNNIKKAVDVKEDISEEDIKSKLDYINDRFAEQSNIRGTVPKIKDKLKHMVNVDGSLVKNSDIKKSIILLNKLNSISTVLDGAQQLLSIERHRQIISDKNTQILQYEMDVKKYLDNAKKKLNGNVNFDKIYGEIASTEKSLNKARENLKKAEDMLSGDKKDIDPEYTKLVEEIGECSKAVGQASIKISFLDVNKEKVDNVIRESVKIKAVIDNWHKELNNIQKECEKDRNDISALDKQLEADKDLTEKDNKKFEDAVKRTSFPWGTKSKFENAIKFEKENIKKRELSEMLKADPDVTAKIAVWMVNFGGSSKSELESHLENEEKEFRKQAEKNPVVRAGLQKTLEAKEMIHALVYDKKMSPTEVKERFALKDYNKYLKQLSDEIAANEARTAEVANKLEANNKKSNLDFKKVIIFRAKSLIQAEQRNAYAEQSKINRKELVNKLKADEERYKTFKGKKIEGLENPECIAKLYKEYATVISDEVVKDNVSKNLIEKINKPNLKDDIKAAKKNIDKYTELLADVVGIGADIKKCISVNREKIDKEKASADKRLKEITVEIKPYKERMEKLRQDIAWASKHSIAANETRLAMLNEVNTKIKGFRITHNNLVVETRNDIESVNKEIKDGKEKIVSDVFEDLKAKYRQLNDHRWKTTNSDKYEAMVTPLCNLMGFAKSPSLNSDPRTHYVRENANDIDPEGMYAALTVMKKAAKEYMDHIGGTHVWSTRQRHARLDFAKQLIDTCDVTIKQFDALNALIKDDVIPTRDVADEKLKVMEQVQNGTITYGNLLEKIAAVDESQTLYNDEDVKGANILTRLP